MKSIIISIVICLLLTFCYAQNQEEIQHEDGGVEVPSHVVFRPLYYYAIDHEFDNVVGDGYKYPIFYDYPFLDLGAGVSVQVSICLSVFALFLNLL